MESAAKLKVVVSGRGGGFRGLLIAKIMLKKKGGGQEKLKKIEKFKVS